MSDVGERSKIEVMKENSRQLRGTIAEELRNDRVDFAETTPDLLKLHGIYQQDDRDTRKSKNADGTAAGKAFSCMVRTRIPGGRVTAKQFLDHLDLCEKYANGTLRITTRQGFQLHGVLKTNLKQAVYGINQTLLTTLAACGDVNRNVMCCPEPIKNDPVHDEMQAMSQTLAEHFRPKTTAYHEIWLTDDDGNKVNVAEFQPVDEPIYGKFYLPRKFKMGIALPSDNCIDIYTQDLGLLAAVEGQKIVGYNILVGGGMGVTPSAAKTFPALAKPLAFVTPDQAVAVSEAVVKVQRDFGNRSDRKNARLKYLVHNWGLDKFREKVAEYYGRPLTPPRDIVVTGVEDHMGWHEQGDGKLYLGINIDCGRIKDEGPLRIKAALRAVLGKFQMPTRLTPLQGALLCDIDPAWKAEISQTLEDHGIIPAEKLSAVRRLAIACPAFPTCGLSLTESERVLPQVVAAFEQQAATLGLQSERIAIHMTGCPNGCARPYTPDIGLVGKTLGKYTIYLGGNVMGTRLGFIYKDLIPLAEIIPSILPALVHFKSARKSGESFGDFCARMGKDQLAQTEAVV